MIPEFKVSVFPNPFTDGFQIVIDDPSDAVLELSVYDMFGRKMTTATVELATLDQMKIRADFPSGIYNVVVKHGNQVQVVRLIKR